MVFPFAQTRFGTRPRKPGWIPAQFDLKIERFGMAYRLLSAYAFAVRNLSKTAHTRRSTRSASRRSVGHDKAGRLIPRRTRGGEAAYPSSPTIFWATHWTALQTLHWKM